MHLSQSLVDYFMTTAHLAKLILNPTQLKYIIVFINRIMFENTDMEGIAKSSQPHLTHPTCFSHAMLS